MAKTLIDCIAQIQTTVTTISGIADPGHGTLDSLGNGIFAVTEPGAGEFTPDQNFRKGLHDIRLLVAVEVDDYPRYRAALIAAVEAVYDALRADVTLAGTCDTISGDITYTYGATQYGPSPVYGATFTIPVKIQ